MFRAAAALGGRELAIGIYFLFETLEESLAGWAGAGTAVTGASPGDLGCYPLIDVLGQMASPPAGGCG